MSLPLYLFVIELNNKCNLNCKHCYIGNIKNKKDISDEDFDIIIDNLRNFKDLERVVFSGGEPLLFSNKIFDYAKKIKKALNCQLVLLTNGILFNNFALSDFEIFDKIQISLDGLEEIHDYFRGQGTFRRAIQSINNLKTVSSVSVMTTVNNINLPCIVELKKLTIFLGVDFSIEKMSIIGNARKNKLRALNKKETYLLYSMAKENNITLKDPIFTCLDLKNVNNFNKIGGCVAGLYALSLSSDLKVYPCVRLRKSAGNLNKNSLVDIYNNSELLNKLRNRSNLCGICKKCKKINICSGCRADSYTHYGNIFKTGKNCIGFLKNN